MSLKPFPGLCSSIDSPVHCLGLYNNVLLLFCVNICYWAGSAFFLPPTFLPVHCQRSVIWTKPFQEILPLTAASLAVICQATSTRPEGTQDVEVLLRVPRGPCSPHWASSLAIQRGLCHISGHRCCVAGGFWAGTWLYNFWALLLPFCRAGQIRLLFFASDQHKGLAKCLLVKLLDLGTKTSRAGVGKGLCRLCQQIYLSLVRVKSCGTETKLLWFLGSPKSKGWVGSYKLPHKLLPLASQSCSVCHLPFSGSCSHLEATQLLKLLFFWSWLIPLHSGAILPHK